MKNLNIKTISLITILLINFILIHNSNAQSNGQAELMIVNNTGTTSGKFIKINIYPVGAIFSGGGQYSLDARYKISQDEKFIFGYSDVLNYNQNLPENQWTTKINFDANDLRQDCETSLGYGKYRIDFYTGPDQDNFIFTDYCIIDYSDANYGKSVFQGEQKIRIDYRTATNITFNFLSSTTPHNINEVGKNIRVWEQFGSGFPPVVPSKGMFNDTTLAQYHNFPIDARVYGAINHVSPGDFGLNMTVKYQGANIKENSALNFKNSAMTINEGIIFTVNNNNSKIDFSGKDSKFIKNNASQVKMPHGFIIRIADTAGIEKIKFNYSLIMRNL